MYGKFISILGCDIKRVTISMFSSLTARYNGAILNYYIIWSNNK